MDEQTGLQIDFYYFRQSPLAEALSMLAYKTVMAGHKLLILARKEHFREISEQLYIQRPDSFLAHNGDDEEGAEFAPVWLSSDASKNPIDANFAALTSAMVPPDLFKFMRIFYLFDGHDDTATTLARNCWKEWSALDGAICRYFAQDEDNRWIQKK